MQRRENSRRLKNTDKHIEDTEVELADLRKRVQNYEGGVYGLVEAIREIKDLRLKLSIRDRELGESALRINDYELQVNEFIDENTEFRKRLNLDDKCAIDLTNLRSRKNLEFVLC